MLIYTQQSMGRENLRYVIGCAASPAMVTRPLRLSHGTVGHSARRLHQMVALGSIPWYAERKGSARVLARSFHACLITLGSPGTVSPSSGNVKLNIHFQVSGLSGSGISCTNLTISDVTREVCIVAATYEP